MNRLVAVLGGGHGAHAMAADLISRGFSVNLYEMPRFKHNLQELFDTRTIEAALVKADAIVQKLEAMKLKTAAQRLREGIAETLSYYDFPSEHWRRIRTNNPLEHIIREVRRRTRVVGAFPDGRSALMLVAARLRYVASTPLGNASISEDGVAQRAPSHQRPRSYPWSLKAALPYHAQKQVPKPSLFLTCWQIVPIPAC